MVKEAVPELSSTFCPMAEDPSSKVTVPVGTEVPPVTEAVKVTDVPASTRVPVLVKLTVGATTVLLDKITLRL